MSYVDRLSPDDWTKIEGCIAFTLTVARLSHAEDDPRVVKLRELLNRVIRARGV